MAQARPRITKELESLPNDKWEYIIDNYIKNEIDRTIAKMYYLVTTRLVFLCHNVIRRRQYV